MKRFCFLCIVLLAGCTLFVAKPEIEVKRVTLSGVDRSGIVLNFLLSIANRNSYAIRLNGYRYDLLVTDLPLAKGENRVPVEFKGNSVTDVELPVKIAFHDLLEILKRCPDPANIPYRLKANFDLHTPFWTVDVPLEKNGILNVPQKYRPDRFMKQFQEFFKTDKK